MSSTAQDKALGSGSRLQRTDYREGNERRKRPRSPLRWTLYLSSTDLRSPFRTKTQDISLGGFYCVLDHALRPGEVLDCDFLVPTHRCQDPNEVVHLRCHARAVRVEELVAGVKFGVGCRIEDDWAIGGTAAPWLA